MPFDGTSDMQNKGKVIQMAKEECNGDRACLGVFVWYGNDHVEAEQRLPNRPGNGYNAVGLSSPGVFGNYFSYDLFVLDTDVTALNSTKADYHLRSGDNQAFTGDSESWIKLISCPGCSLYSGPCIHEQSGFCMEEVPGTTNCLPGFTHCNQEYYDNENSQ